VGSGVLFVNIFKVCIITSRTIFGLKKYVCWRVEISYVLLRQCTSLFSRACPSLAKCVFTDRPE
jgi:hypothetical protein